MWAHYAGNGTGICLGFDEDALVDEFPVAYVGDLSYSNGPATVESDFVKWALAQGSADTLCDCWKLDKRGLFHEAQGLGVRRREARG